MASTHRKLKPEKCILGIPGSSLPLNIIGHKIDNFTNFAKKVPNIKVQPGFWLVKEGNDIHNPIYSNFHTSDKFNVDFKLSPGATTRLTHDSLKA